MSQKRFELPVQDIVPEIKEKLQDHWRLILQAPPGAGKTTALPLELLSEDWALLGRIVMLEPRRIAAKSAARWMARCLGGKVGDLIGYSVHLDRNVSEQTRIEVVTEGVLLGRLLSDPELKGVSMVIFDEFHERNLESDLCLALLRESQEALRDDLKIMVMSATLDGEPVSRFLGGAPVVSSRGKSFPVEILYRAPGSDGNLIGHTVSVIREALRCQEGSVLVFLPGMGEINRVFSSLNEQIRDRGDVLIQPLHGSLPSDEQEKAIEPSGPGIRKVVLATSIAESSITIKGIRIVIDSGLIRKPRFNSRTAMDSLETLFVSRASADQRTGRAGRIEPGVCYRLWDRNKKLENFSDPAILTEDLGALALSLARWGAADSDKVQWLTEPNRQVFAKSRNLLKSLGAVDAMGITDKGEKMSRLPLHPRLASMVIEGRKRGLGSLACDLAALLSERDILTFQPDHYQSDLGCRLEALDNRNIPYSRLNGGAAKRVISHSESMQARRTSYSHEGLGSLLISAYPDRIARNLGEGLFQLSNGSNAVLSDSDALFSEKFLAVPSLGGTGSVPRIFLACPVAEEEILENLQGELKREENLHFIKDRKKFSARRQLKLGHILLKEENINNLPVEVFHEALLRYLSEKGLSDLNWTGNTENFRNRVSFLHRQGMEGYPDLSDRELVSDLDWLKPYLGGISLKNPLTEIPLLDALKGMLDWAALSKMDSYAPTHYEVPSGSRIPVDYSGKDPVLKVRLQELFGLRETPSLCGGSCPLVLHLLSPASRPIQITRDLMSFWENTYGEVKKDLMGRYPKHFWPENPLDAEPTNKVRKRM